MIKITTYTVGFEDRLGSGILYYTHDINQAEKTLLDCVESSKTYKKIYIVVDSIDVKEYLNKNQDNLSYLEALKISKSFGISLDPAWRETKKTNKKTSNNKRTYAKCGIGGINKKR